MPKRGWLVCDDPSLGFLARSVKESRRSMTFLADPRLAREWQLGGMPEVSTAMTIGTALAYQRLFRPKLRERGGGAVRMQSCWSRCSFGKAERTS
jgi:hypothetical protein